MTEPDLSPLLVFVLAFALSACAGLAALLKFGKQPTGYGILSAMLYSGMSGLGVAMVWYTTVDGNKGVYVMLGGCIGVGLTGAKVSDVLLNVFAGKIKVSLTPPDEEGKT